MAEMEETAKKNEAVVEKMNDLIQLDLDAIRAYDQAIEACDVQEIRSKLTEFKNDHERHVEDLSACVKSYGGEPRTSRDLKGFLIEGFTGIMSRGDHSALVAMRGNEELTNRSYESALRGELPDDVRPIVERNREDERRHLEWIVDALDKKVWERKAA